MQDKVGIFDPLGPLSHLSSRRLQWFDKRVGGGDINIHIDINMNIDIHIIINMNIEDYINYFGLFISQ